MYKRKLLYFFLLSCLFQLNFATTNEFQNYFDSYLKNDISFREINFDSLKTRLNHLKIEQRIGYLKILEEKYPEKTSFTYCKVLSTLANQFIFTNEIGIFERYYAKSIEIAKNNNFKEQIINIYLLKSQNFKIHNILDSALYYCLISEELLKNNDFLKQKSEVYHLIGDIYYHLELKEIAEKYYLKVIDYHLEDKDWIEWQKIVIYTDLGNINSSFKRFSEASSLYNIALHQINQNKINGTSLNTDEQTAHVFKRFAEFYYDQNIMDSAKFYITNAIYLLEVNKVEIFQPGIFLSASKIYLNLNELSIAKDYIEKAGKLLDTTNVKLMRDYYFNLARINFANGNTKIAYELLYKSYDLNFKFNQKNNPAIILEPKILRDFDNINEELKRNKYLNIMYLGLSIFLILFILVIFIFNRKLKDSYKKLVSKTLKVVNFNDNLSKEILNRENEDNLQLVVKDKINENDDYLKSHSNLLNIDTIINNIESEIYYNELNIHENEFKDLADKIDSFLENSEIYYNSDFGINDLASLMNSNRTYVSKAINGKFNQSFQIYINEKRIKSLINMLSTKNIRDTKLEYLMKCVGFTNRGTFITAFKNFTGLTPSNFIKNFNG